MLNTKQKIAYLIDSTLRVFEKKQCPHCNSVNCRKIDQKYFVTKLLECQDCYFRFRHPYDSVSKNKEFYQKEYFEEDLLTTDLPTKEQLKDFISNNFADDANKSIERYLPLFDSLFQNNRNIHIVDYGASWGYISHQFGKAGYHVQSFEISKPRAKYGNDNLDVNIVTSTDELKEGADIFFSSHVIEHVPSITDMLNVAKRVLKKGGYFIALCPNGSDALRTADAHAFHFAWGKVHPNYLNDAFYKKLFAGNNYYIGTTPINYSAVQHWGGNGKVVDKLDTIELLCIAKF